MSFAKRLILALAIAMVSTGVLAQDRFYHVYVDTDNNTSSGCDIDLPDFSTAINGVEGRVTITTNSDQPPSITDTRFHTCNAGLFDAGTAINAAALGLNTGLNNADVFEAQISRGALGINTSGPVIFYYATESNTASDIVLTNSNGGPIFLGFTFPVPSLGLFAFGLLILGFVLIARRNISHKLTMTLLLIGASSIAWAMTIIVDGQTTDWNNINPQNSDPINDTSAPGSFADLTQVYLVEQNEVIYFRMDVVDLENQAPVANNTSDNTLEENTVTITVTGSDAENEPLTFAVNTPPANGTLSGFTVLNPTTSTVDYTPNTDFNGIDTFTFVANDGQVNSGDATVDVTVTGINDEPTFTSGGNVNQLKTSGPYSENWATDISAGAVNEAAQNLTFNILSNDNPAIFTALPSIDASGLLTFEGILNATGTANLTVNLVDDGGVANGGDDTSITVNFSITLQGVNDEPSFTAGANQTVNEDAGAVSVISWATAISAGPADESGQVLTFNVTANDNTALFSAGPAVAADGTLSYTTAADANGLANITLELMDDGGTANGGDDTSPPQSFLITVNAVNDVPSFASGGDVTVSENSGAIDTPWATAISAGPTNESGQVLSFNTVNVSNSSLFDVLPTVDSSSGNLSFTPAVDQFGTSTITINLMDDGLTVNGGQDTTTDITFDISVSEVNEPPVLANIINPNIDELTLLAFTATATDPNIPAQNLTFSLAGTVPVGANITTDGDFTWTPTEAQGTTGSFTFDVVVTDDGTNPDNLTDSQTITVTVNKVNSAPVLTAIGPQSTDELVELSFTATANDTDTPAQNLSFSLAGAVPTGASISTAGLFTWTPTETQGPGVFNFDVVVTDNGTNPANLSDSETITIAVNDVNSVPVLTAIGNQTVDEETLLSFTASANDSDIPAQSLTFSLGGTVPTGASISSGGMFSWTPTEAQGPGVYNFDVVVTDNGTNPANLSASETIAVTVNEINAIPVADAQSATTDDATPLAITLTGSDSEGSALTFAIDTAPATGSLGAITQLTPSSASVTYTPGSVGNNDFTFVVNDGVQNSAPATVTLDVTSSNTAPTGVNDAYNVTGNVGINVPVGSGVTANDTDPELDTLTVTAFDAVSTQGGTVSANANGSFTYDPAAGFTGADSFNYTVSDGLLTDTATVNLTVANMIWFIDNSAVAGDGRLTSPFNSILSYNSTATDSVGDVIYIDFGNGSSVGYDSSLPLFANQRLLGQGAGLSTALTGINYPVHSRTLPAIANNPTLVASNANSIILGSNNTVRGLTVGNTGNGVAIFGQPSFGNLTVSDVTINGTGKALDLVNGTLDATFDAISATSSSTEIIDILAANGQITVNGGSMSGAGANSNTVALNTNAGALTANFNAVTIGANDQVTGINGINFITSGTASGVLNVNNSTFTGSANRMISAVITGTGGGSINIGTGTGNQFTRNQNPLNLNGETIGVFLDGTGQVSTNITNNSILAGAFAFQGDGIFVRNADTYSNTHRVTIENNTIGTSGVNGSAFNPADNSGDAGIVVRGGDAGNMIALITNNRVFDYNASGIEADFVANSGSYDLTITNNTISDGLGSSGFDAAVAVFGGVNASSAVTACIQIDNNALNDPSNEEVDVDVFNDAGAYRDPGLATLTDPGLEAHLLSTNTGTAPYTTVAFTSGTLGGGAACAQP